MAIIAENYGVVKRFVLIVMMTLTVSLASGQEQDEVSAVMKIAGAGEEEQLSEQLMEHYAYMERHPLEINMASSSKLLSSGLFSQYQIASLLDYRSHNGDILSFEELSMVDGIGKDYAAALRRYVSLYSPELPGAVRHNSMTTEATARVACKPGAWQEKGRVLIEYGDRLSGSASMTMDRVGFHLSYSGRRRLDRLVFGDYHAKFGQGLVLWSGFSMSGMSATSSLYRRPSGISPSTSYSGTGLRGIATQLVFGKLRLALLSGVDWHKRKQELPDIRIGTNLSCFFRNGQTGVTAYSELPLGGTGWGISGDKAAESSAVQPSLRVGADSRFCIKGVDVFAEGAYDAVHGKVACVGGLVFPVGNSRLGTVLRYYPSDWDKELVGSVHTGTYSRDETAASVSYELKSLVLCTDYYIKNSTGRQQIKLTAMDEIKTGETISLKPRATVRLRTMGERARYDLRNDVVWMHGPWTITIRLNWLHCLGNGWLSYLEGGYKTDRLSVYGRVTGFVVDHWDDRIYSYERDAPGSFNVPAYYGRGLSASFYAAWKPEIRKLRLKLYAAAYVKKPGSPGLRFQSTLDF